MNHQRPTVISCFAGCGGSTQGYLLASFRELLAIEKFGTAVKVFKRNFPTIPVIQRDIATVTAQECLQVGGLEIGQLDLLDASPPCRGYSIAGPRNFDSPFNRLYKEAVRLAEALRPKVVLIENVSALVRVDCMKVWAARIVSDLRRAGYVVQGAGMDAQWLKVPQRRARVFIMGVRKDLKTEPSVPSPVIGQVKTLRLDARPFWKASHNKLKIVPEGVIAPTLTAHTQFLWSIHEEWGIESYKHVSGYPAEFSFPPDVGHRQRVELIGNCVPPLMMQAIASHIRHHILRI